MGSFQDYMNEFKIQIKKGDIVQAYQGLMDYFRDLRSHFVNKFPTYSVPGNIYYGYMDMTYFAIIPESFQSHDLKIAIVFVFETFRFEVWLSGKNKKVLMHYWEKIKKSAWNKYSLTEPGKGIDFILDHVLIADPDFNDLEALTAQIETGILDFIQDIEDFCLPIK